MSQWTRAQATRSLFKRLHDEPVISSLSCATIDAFNTEDRDRNYYLFGGMGMCSSIALGLALTYRQGRVVALEGDGALLMNLGSLATIAVAKPTNLVLIVWDNGRYESTGGQLTHAGRGVDLRAMASAAGIEKSVRVKNADQFEETLDQVFSEDGPWVVVANVVGDTDKSKCPPWTPVVFKQRFVESLRNG